MVHTGPSQSGNKGIAVTAFRSVTEYKDLWDKWIEDHVWIDLIKERFTISNDLNISPKQLNMALMRDPFFQQKKRHAATGLSLLYYYLLYHIT